MVAGEGGERRRGNERTKDREEKRSMATSNKKKIFFPSYLRRAEPQTTINPGAPLGLVLRGDGQRDGGPGEGGGGEDESQGIRG